MQSKKTRIKRLRRKLLAWGKENIRSYPWRYRESPYEVITAEFMLHRTQAPQVEKIYRRFMAACPTLADFINTDRDKVTELLSSLGLNWRIRGMIDALQELWEQYRAIPQDIDGLMAIHGIGQYIAGATVCFTMNRPVTLVDSNTVRVIGRVFGLDLSGEARRRREVIETIGEACDPDQPRDFYYAMIDLAHTICTPKNPDCPGCPLLDVPCNFGRGQSEHNKSNESEVIQE